MSDTRTGSPVTVGCKLPNGLILKVGDTKITLKGANSSRVIGGYGLTSIPSDFWDAWAKAYAASPFIKNRIVFAETSVSKAEGKAAEQDTVKTGLEPLDPDKPAPGIVKAEK